SPLQCTLGRLCCWGYPQIHRRLVQTLWFLLRFHQMIDSKMTFLLLLLSCKTPTVYVTSLTTYKTGNLVLFNFYGCVKLIHCSYKFISILMFELIYSMVVSCVSLSCASCTH